MDQQPRSLRQALRLLTEVTWPKSRWERADFLLSALVKNHEAGDADRFTGAGRELVDLFSRRRVSRKANMPQEEQPINDLTRDLVDKISHILESDAFSEDGDDGTRPS